MDKTLLVKEYKQCNPSLSIRRLCRSMGLCRASFYAGLKAMRHNEKLDKEVWDQIVTLWETFPGIGYRKLCPKLGIGAHRVMRILRNFRHPKPSRINPKPTRERRIPNVLKMITNDLKTYSIKLGRGNWILREGKNKYRHIIDPTRPYQLWAGDWKELRVPLLGTTLYIFTIIDCYTRQLMGWELSIIKDSSAAIKASRAAILMAEQESFFNPRKLIMHTDQGGAYVADDYISYWRDLGVILSTADKGKPTQNPYAEAFFSIVRRFCLNYSEILTITDAKKSIIDFFNLYNQKWPHGAINNMSPNQKLESYRCSLKSKNNGLVFNA